MTVVLIPVHQFCDREQSCPTEVWSYPRISWVQTVVALLWSAVYLPTKVSVDRHKVPSKSHGAAHCRGCFLLRQTRQLSELVFLQLHVNFPHLELFKAEHCRSNGVDMCAG